MTIADSSELESEVRRRIDRFLQQRDTTAVLEPDAVILARQALQAAGAGERWEHEHASLVSVVGWLYLFRWEASDIINDQDGVSYNHGICVRVFMLIWQSRPDLVPEGMQELVSHMVEMGVSADLAGRTFDLATLILEQGQASKDRLALDAAIDLFERGFALPPSGRNDPVTDHYNFAMALWHRQELTGDLADLNRGITEAEEALEAMGLDRPERAAMLQNLGVALQARFDRLGSEPDLARAIDVRREALARTALDDSARPERLSGLGISLRERYDRTGAAPDIDEAIELSQQAIGQSGPSSPHYAGYLSMLSLAWHSRFRRVGDDHDLHEAVATARLSVQHAEAEDPHRARYFTNLSIALTGMFYRHRDPAVLDEIIQADREAVLASGPGHELPNRLAALSIGLSHRYLHHGTLSDLNEAIQLAREAVSSTPSDAADRASFLFNLANDLTVRYEVTENADDLTEAVAVMQEAVDTSDPHDLDHAARLAGMSWVLRAQASRSKNIDDARHAVERAVEYGQLAVAASPTRGAEHAKLLIDLCIAQRELSYRTSDINDVDTAIQSGLQALDYLPPSHPLRTGAHIQLSACFSERFRLTRHLEDADSAIAHQRNALAGLSDNEPRRAAVLTMLGTMLLNRLDATPAAETTDQHVLAEAFTLCRQATAINSAEIRIRFQTAALWARKAAQYQLLPDAVEAHTVLIRLLPLAAWHGLDHASRLARLRISPAAARDAAAWAIRAGELKLAVELVEQGRTVIWSQTLQLRTDADRLREDHSDVADRLDAIRSQIDSHPAEEGGLPPLGTRRDAWSSPTLGHSVQYANEYDHERRMRLADEWDQLLNSVRRLPSYGDFLRPPSFDDLVSGIGGRTVVIINVSDVGCDAILIVNGMPYREPLPLLTAADVDANVNAYLNAYDRLGQSPPSDDADQHEKLQDEVERLAAQQRIDRILAWLWDKAMSQILDRLGAHAGLNSQTTAPHIWWCPTGPLSLLPLHAAGHHNAAATGRSTIDRVVSSYTPTLAALRRSIRYTPDASTSRMLVVAVPKAPRKRFLKAARSEAEALAGLFIPDVTVYQDDVATKAQVLEALMTHRAVHFACHAHIDMHHSQDGSGLNLHDKILSISALSRLQLSAPELAYLSACDTARHDARLPDEALSIAGALYLAGFKHIIATLAPVDDKLAADIAAQIYGDLHGAKGSVFLDCARAAQALHAAIRHARSTGHAAHQWCTYIHIGP